jgi:hypothetical protein
MVEVEAAAGVAFQRLVHRVEPGAEERVESKTSPAFQVLPTREGVAAAGLVTSQLAVVAPG